MTCRVQKLTEQSTVTLLICLVLLFAVFGCNTQNTTDKRFKLPTAKKYPKRNINGFEIPILGNAERQLAYAQSGLEKSIEQLAALTAVELLFPESRLETGLAALEIAYLTLGDDYRLASTAMCQKASRHYSKIVSEYSDKPEIAAKALWYRGWISSDLLKKPEEGVAYYREILEIYVDARINLKSPPPWISILPHDDRKAHTPFLAKSAMSWSELALLELIRNSRSKTESMAYLFDLQNRTEHAFLKVEGFKIYVAIHGLNRKIEDRIRTLIDSGTFSSQHKKDLLSILTDDEA